MGRVKYRYNIEDFCYKVKKTWEIEFGWMPPSHNVRSWQRDHMNRMFDLLFVILYHCSVNFGGFMCGCVSVIHGGFSHHNQIQVKFERKSEDRQYAPVLIALPFDV